MSKITICVTLSGSSSYSVCINKHDGYGNYSFVQLHRSFNAMPVIGCDPEEGARMFAAALYNFLTKQGYDVELDI